MQSMAKDTSNPNRPAKLTMLNTLKFIYKENGIKGLYRGVTPRIGLGIWQTVCMVSFADYVKAWYVLRNGFPANFISSVLQGEKAIDDKYPVIPLEQLVLFPNNTAFGRLFIELVLTACAYLDDLLTLTRDQVHTHPQL